MAKENKTKKKRSTDLEDMREAYRKHKQRSKGGGGSSNDWDKLGDGKNMRRILPRVVDGETKKKFYTEGWTHFNVGPNQRAVRCIDEGSMNEERGLPESGTGCPLCKKFLREQARINSEYEKGDEDGRAEWKRAKDKYVPRHQYYSNVLREDDDGDFEVKTLAYGPQVWGQLMNYYLETDTNIGDFTDPTDGRWMNIKKEKKGGRDRRNIEYKVYPDDDTQDISDAMDDIIEAMHDLDAAAGKVLSRDEVLAIMKGIDVDKGSDDDDDDDDDDDEDEDEDDDRDDDDGDEDEEEDDDEDDRPVKVKKSKLSKKMKKRRNRDDD